MKAVTGVPCMLLAAVLAGCSGGGQDAPPADIEPPLDIAGRALLLDGGEVAGYALTDCIEWGGTYPVPSSGWDLPPQFAPLETSDGMTFLLEVFYFCTSGAVEVNEHLFMLPVVPPPHLANATARFQVVLLAGLAAGTSDLYAAWGFGDVLVRGWTTFDASAVPTFDHAWQATTPEWHASIEADFDVATTTGEAGFARIFHPTHPTRIVHISWSDYEQREDGGTSLLDARGLPAVAAGIDVPVLQGVPFARSGSSYDWEVRRVGSD